MDLKNFVNDLTIADKIYLYNTLYEDLACKGIDGDTELAHVNKQEMAVLRAMGGSGTINPNTNLIQFGGGGGSPPPPPPATQTVTQQATIPDELKPFITDILEKSKAIQQRRESEGYVPFQGPRLADFTQEQTEAFEGIKELQGAGQPFYDTATALTASSALAPTSESVGQLMNPFIQNVIDVQTREALRQGDLERQQIGEAAVQAGGFGGSRHAILEAEQARNLQQRLGDIQARGQAAAFEDAQARLQQQRDRERQAATQFASLGQQVPGQRLRELTGLEAIGAQKQALGQAGIDIAAQEFEIGRSFPERTLQDYQSIVRGYAQPIPASTLQRQATQQPAPSFLQQAAGLGAAGLGAFKAFGGNAQGGLVGLAEGGQADEGTTLLETQVEDISERAETDPFGDRNRQALSQTQQFVRGREEEEAATVADQLKQIQGLALGATNAIAQGQRQLASMNTAPGVGAPPNNFGGNVGSFGFKKGGMLALKHLANGGIVKLAAGGTGGSGSGTQKDILARLSMDELIKASSNPNFSIKLVTDELMKRKADRTARSMSERRLKSRAERDSFPAISEEEVSNTLLTESYTPEESILKQLQSTVKPEDTQSFAQRQLKAKQPPAQSELTGKEITSPEAFKLRSENRPVSPLQKHIREAASPFAIGQAASAAQATSDDDKLGSPATRDIAEFLRQKDRSGDAVEQRYDMIRSLESQTGRPYGLNIMPTSEGVLNRLSVAGEKIGGAKDYLFGERDPDRPQRLQELDKQYGQIDQRQIPLIKELRRLKSLDKPEVLADDAALSGESSELRKASYYKQPDGRGPTTSTSKAGGPETAQQAIREVGMTDIGLATSPDKYKGVEGYTDTQETIAIGDSPEQPLGVGDKPDMEQLGLESIEEIMKKGEAAPAIGENEKKVKESLKADIEGGGVAADYEFANTTKVEFISEVDKMRNSPEYLKMTEINERLKEATGKERELLQKQLDAGGDYEKGLALMDLGFGILAQPGGQTFLEAIGKGAKDSKFTTKLAKLSDKQKKLALDFAKLDRRELQDELGLSKQQATMVMEGRKLDIQKRVADAQLRNATTKAQTAAAKAKLDKLEFGLKEMKHYMDASKFKMDTKDQISFATESFKSAIDLDNLRDSDKKLLKDKGYNPTKGFFMDTTGEDVTEDSKNVNEWIGFYNVALGEQMSPTDARKFATTNWIKGLKKYSK